MVNQYPWYARYYSLWWFILAAAFLVLMEFIWFQPRIINHVSYALGCSIFVIVMIVQFFVTEKRAQYWPVRVAQDGLEFLSGGSYIKVRWSEIENIKKFPNSDFLPSQWYQAMFSSGVLLSANGKEYVIYRKIKGYNGILNALRENT